MKVAAWTASTFLSERPTEAEIHENVNPTAITSRSIQIAFTNPFENLKPTRYPITSTIATRIRFFARSNVVRPTSTAERAIGSDRNLSMIPSFMSSARPIAVVVAPKIAFWMKIPGIRKST